MRRLLVLLVIAIGLCACGNGSSASVDAAPPVVLPSVFGQSSGGGVRSSANFTLELSIGVPMSVTRLDSQNYSLTLGVGMPRR